MRALIAVMSLLASNALADSLPGLQPSKLSLTSQLIDLQIQRLELDRVSLAGPVVPMVIGTAGIIGGVALLFLPGAFPVAFAMLATAAIPTAAGIVWLAANLVHNHRIDVEIAILEDERIGLRPVSRVQQRSLIHVASF